MPLPAVEEPIAADPDATGLSAPSRAIAVLHVINGEHYAGAERVQDLLAQNLGQFGFRPAFACLKQGQFAQMREGVDAPLYEVPMRRRFDLRPAWELARLIRSEGFQLIHSHTARSALVAGGAAALTGVPWVHHVHSPAGRDTTHRLRNWINGLTERVVLRRATALVAVSESLGQYLRRQGLPAARIAIVPNGVPPRQAVPGRDPAATSWTLGTMALFRPRKGLEVLLRAVAALRRDGLAVRLRAVGGFETPEYEQRVRALADELDLAAAVDWTGFARDVDRQLAHMDVFVLPSLFGEGLPMVVLEAMSAGLPIVASRVEGVPEAVRDGCEGLLVEPRDAEDLARAVRRFVSGDADWRAMAASARARHAQRFSALHMAAGVAAVYRRALG
jgi:glycosyltransferase involved in cell wall biosynthesis